MLVQRRRRWAVVVQVLYKYFVFVGYALTSLGKRDNGDKKRLITQVLRLIALKQPSQQAQVVDPMLI